MLIGEFIIDIWEFSKDPFKEVFEFFLEVLSKEPEVKEFFLEDLWSSLGNPCPFLLKVLEI